MDDGRDQQVDGLLRLRDHALGVLRDPLQLALQVSRCIMCSHYLTLVDALFSKWKAITVKERVMAGYRMSTPAKMPEQVAALMRRCWDHDASKRPNATEIREELERISQVGSRSACLTSGVL